MTQARYYRRAATLDATLAAARPGIEALGIVVGERAGSPECREWMFTRTVEIPPYSAKVAASTRYTLGGVDADQCGASWIAEAWGETGTIVHTAQGSAVIGPERFTYGRLERLVVALLRRAAVTFPDPISDVAWPVFPDLPDIAGEADYLAEVRAFHRTMIEPWTGPPVGCSRAEIDTLEARLGWRLPLAYRQYLGFMGHDDAGVFVGSDWFIESATINGACSALSAQAVAYGRPARAFLQRERESQAGGRLRLLHGFADGGADLCQHLRPLGAAVAERTVSLA